MFVPSGCGCPGLRTHTVRLHIHTPQHQGTGERGMDWTGACGRAGGRAAGTRKILWDLGLDWIGVIGGIGAGGGAKIVCWSDWLFLFYLLAACVLCVRVCECVCVCVFVEKIRLELAAMQ